MIKQPNHSSLHFIFLASLLCGSLAPGHAAQAGHKKPRTPDDYQLRTLKEIVSMKPDPKDLRDKQDRLVVTANDLPSRVSATYTGATRSIPQLKKEVIRQWARLYAGSIEHYTEPYQSEMLFMDAGVGYWLAVPKNSRLSQNLTKGQTVNLYLVRVGAAIFRDKFDWILLVEDFREAETSRPAAEIKFREMRPRKPPLTELSFDIVLRNDRARPRWFLVPSNLGPGTTSLLTKGGIDGVEVFAPRGQGRVIVGHFLGTGGFYALLLPARARVHLGRFPISYWGDLPDQLQVEVVTAKRLTIGNEPASVWFGLNPTSSVRADITENVLSQNRMVSSRHTPDRKEVTTLIEKDGRFRIQVSLKEKE